MCSQITSESSRRDNLSKTKISRKNILQGLQKLGEVVRCVGFQMVCNKDYDMYRTFSEKSGNVLSFLRVSTSGATDSEFFEMMLESIGTYLPDGKVNKEFN